MFDVGLNFRTTVVDTTSKETVTNTKEISIRFGRTAALLPVSCFQLYLSNQNFDLFLDAIFPRDEGGKPSLTIMYYTRGAREKVNMANCTRRSRALVLFSDACISSNGAERVSTHDQAYNPSNPSNAKRGAPPRWVALLPRYERFRMKILLGMARRCLNRCRECCQNMEGIHSLLLWQTHACCNASGRCCSSGLSINNSHSDANGAGRWQPFIDTSLRTV